jgi:phospholipase C
MPISHDPSRRQLLAGLASGTAAATLAACGDSLGPSMSSPVPAPTPTPGGVSPAPQAPAGKVLPDPAATGIDHIVVLMMENRTFDHMLGWVPGADGVQADRKSVV